MAVFFWQVVEPWKGADWSSSDAKTFLDIYSATSQQVAFFQLDDSLQSKPLHVLYNHTFTFESLSYFLERIQYYLRNGIDTSVFSLFV